MMKSNSNMNKKLVGAVGAAASMLLTGCDNDCFGCVETSYDEVTRMGSTHMNEELCKSLNGEWKTYDVYHCYPCKRDPEISDEQSCKDASKDKSAAGEYECDWGSDNCAGAMQDFRDGYLNPDTGMIENEENCPGQWEPGTPGMSQTQSVCELPDKWTCHVPDNNDDVDADDKKCKPYLEDGTEVEGHNAAVNLCGGDEKDLTPSLHLKGCMNIVIKPFKKSGDKSERVGANDDDNNGEVQVNDRYETEFEATGIKKFDDKLKEVDPNMTFCKPYRFSWDDGKNVIFCAYHFAFLDSNDNLLSKKDGDFLFTTDYDKKVDGHYPHDATDLKIAAEKKDYAPLDKEATQAGINWNEFRK